MKLPVEMKATCKEHYKAQFRIGYYLFKMLNDNKTADCWLSHYNNLVRKKLTTSKVKEEIVPKDS